MTEKQNTGADATRTYLHQEVDLKATPQKIYEILLDSKQFAAFTGMPAEISRDSGGAFSMFGGMIVGRNVELVANQLIVQAWRPASWNSGVYSIVRFELKGDQCSDQTDPRSHRLPRRRFRAPRFRLVRPLLEPAEEIPCLVAPKRAEKGPRYFGSSAFAQSANRNLK